MSRIAGLIHWGSSPQQYTRATLRGMLAHMTKSDPISAIFQEGGFGVAGQGGDIAQQMGGILALDGRLVDRDRLDDGEPGGDAALLLRLCLRLGFEAAMQLVDGDIAVAFLDVNARRLWLARGRFGIKPIYYA